MDAAADTGACLVKAGTYAIKQAITVSSRKVLRGEGPGKTVLNNRYDGGTTVVIGSTDGIDSNQSQLALAGGYTKDSTSLVMAAAPPFGVGSYLAVTEDPDPAIVNPDGADGTCTWCGGPWQNGAGTQFMAQIVKVTAVSNVQVTIDRPLYYTFLSSLNPVVLPLTNIVEDAGVESLAIDEMATG